jgi:diacylglycerol kinase family enzyme
MYSFKTRKICFESDEPLKWTLDGEFGGEHNKTELEVMPQAVEFIVKKRKKNQEKP